MADDNEETRGRNPRKPVLGKPGEAASNVTVRLTATERAAFASDAKRAGMSLSDWIRAACAAFLKRAKR